MKKTKKLLTIFITLTLLVCIINGCSSDSESGTVKEKTKTEEPKPEEKKEVKVSSNKATDEEIEKTCAEFDKEFEALPNPASITSPDEYIVYYKQYADLFAKTTEFHSENLEGSRILQTYMKITSVMPDWTQNGNKLGNSFANNAEGIQKAADYYSEVKACISTMKTSLGKLTSAKEKLESAQ